MGGPARIDELPERAAPERLALVAGTGALTYAELLQRAQQIGGGLHDAGAGPGERVALQIEDPLQLVPAMLATWQLGAAVVVVSPGVKERKQQRIRELAEPRLWLRDGDPLLHATGAGRLAANVRGGELAAIIFTSGTTGMPRGVEHTHASLLAAVRGIEGYLQHRPDDVLLSALPLAFSYGLAQLLSAWAAGATLVLAQSFTYPREFLELAARHRASGIPLVPTMAALLQRTDTSGLDLSALRYVTTAGAGLRPALGDALRAKFPQAALYVMYGQTECIRASYLPPEEYAQRPDSIGRGMPGVELAVTGPDRRVLAKPAQGELLATGHNVMRGYRGDPEGTAAKVVTLPDGRRALHTGDLCTIDADGWVRFVARSDEVIKSRGEKVPPAEVEEVLLQFPGVREAAVVGVADPVLGAAIKAVLVPEPGAQLDPRAVQRHCAARLEEFMVPRRIELRDSLPRNDAGKILRSEL